MPLDGSTYVTKPDVLTEAQRVCVEAADYIEKYGWCQGTIAKPTGDVCLMGALRAAAGIPDKAQWTALGTAALNLVHATLPCILPADWNDEEQRTKDEVVALLRSASHAQSNFNLYLQGRDSE